MRVTLEKGETLDVALVENNQIVGTLSLVLRPVGGGTRSVSASAPAMSSSAPKAAGRGGKRGRRGGKRNISPEARARMAEAQKRRWAKFRGDKK